MDPVENDYTNGKISVKLLVKCKNYIIKTKGEYFLLVATCSTVFKKSFDVYFI